MKHLINIHSYTDIITNSSSELFAFKDNTKTASELNEMFSSLWKELNDLNKKKAELIGEDYYEPFNGYYDTIESVTDFIERQPNYKDKIIKIIGSPKLSNWYLIDVQYSDENTRCFLENNFHSITINELYG